MQISFSQAEIILALEEFLSKQIAVLPGQKVTIDFDLADPKDIIAFLDISREGDAPANRGAVSGAAIVKASPAVSTAPVAEKPAPKPRGPKKEQTKTEAAPVEAPEEDVSETADETEAVAEEKVDAPFPGPFASKASAEDQAVAASTAAASQAIEEKVEPVEAVSEVEAIKSGNSIFPSAGTSAAVTPAPVASANPKSLFANLTRPTNTPTAH